MPKPQQAPIVKKGSPKAAAAGGPSPLAAAKAEEAGAAAAKTEADAAAKGPSAAGPSQEKPAGPGVQALVMLWGGPQLYHSNHSPSEVSLTWQRDRTLSCADQRTCRARPLNDRALEVP